MTPDEAIIRVIATEVVDQAKFEFSKIVDTQIRLHYADNKEIQDARVDNKIIDEVKKHAEFCEVAKLLQVTKTKVIAVITILLFISGGSAELMRKFFEWVTKP